MKNEINGAQAGPVAKVGVIPEGTPTASDILPPACSTTMTESASNATLATPDSKGSPPPCCSPLASAPPTSAAHPAPTQHEPEAQPPTQPEVPKDTVRVEYAIRVLGGQEVVADIQSRFDWPLALREECLPRTDCDFPEILDKIVVAPLITQFRGFLLSCYERFAEAGAKQSVLPLVTPCAQTPAGLNLKVPKPPKSTGFGMPELNSKPPPPFPQMPGDSSRFAIQNGD